MRLYIRAVQAPHGIQLIAEDMYEWESSYVALGLRWRRFGLRSVAREGPQGEPDETMDLTPDNDQDL